MNTPSVPRVTRSRFGVLPDGSDVERIVLHAPDGLEARIITYGASLQALLVPDTNGHRDDIVLGHDAFEGYLARRQFFGATVGRYANRIAGARFTLDGAEVHLAANNGANALHGGLEGFDRRNWRIVAIEDGDHPAVTLAYTSADGEEGYPGTLEVEVTWRLAGPMELRLDMTARTDRPTVVNLTNHSFFNLAGARSGRNILDHHLTVAADHFLAIDAGAIPLPQPPSVVADTPFDFRAGVEVGARIRNDHPQLRVGRGYDHNFCLAPPSGEPRFAARLAEPTSGRVLELFTNQPGLQVYSGNFLDGSTAGKGGRLYRQSDAMCLEPHAWPNTPNRPDFPTARLAPGEVYRHTTLYRFTHVIQGLIHGAIETQSAVESPEGAGR
jgi:aldose 1-epimerase